MTKKKLDIDDSRLRVYINGQVTELSSGPSVHEEQTAPRIVPTPPVRVASCVTRIGMGRVLAGGRVEGSPISLPNQNHRKYSAEINKRINVK